MPPKAARGRPLKFGRPARTVAVTLPEDVIAALQAIDSDIARAIVALVISQGEARAPRRRVVDLASMGRRQALIVVDPREVPPLPGCSLVSVGTNRALIALEEGGSLADVEVAVLDRLAGPGVSPEGRRALRLLRRALRTWRTDPRIDVRRRSIVVLEGQR